ncbi:ABC transporter substrate-binding protein [Ochrobactrum sp. XJ1]|nr:ABC transporter substrate-binding protein [Ochrobactrum sp. XJ1]
MFEISRRNLISSSAIGLGALAMPFGGSALADDRTKMMRYVTPGAVNSLDPVAFTATTESTAMSAAVYDRLFRFGKKPNGETFTYDFNDVQGELAEKYEISDNGRTLTIYVRPNAMWHDGTPVTAADVKWSLERAVTAETMSKAQMSTGSLTKDATIEAVDDKIVKVTLAKGDRLAIPNLTTLYSPMFNSTLVKKHTTEADPWGLEWLKTNTAAGGAYTVERFVSGEQVVLKRNDKWTNGPLPFMERVILQTVPAAATRRSLVERGDADITIQLQTADVVALENSKNVRVASMPMPTAFVALSFNTRMAPFDNPLVRQAIAAATPYEDLLSTAALGRGVKLFGGDWSGSPPSEKFPQPMPEKTNIELAKQKLAEAGFKDGFETTLSYGAYRAEWADIAAPLIQEALGKIGIKVKIQKLADAQFTEAVTNKTMPMMLERSLAYFPVADYFFRVFLSGEQRWNFSSWKNARVDELLAIAKYEVDPVKYGTIAKELISLFNEEKPMLMLWGPNLDVAMVPSLSGFTIWPSYYLDSRDPVRKS